MPAYICPYIKECPIYKEEVPTSGAPLTIYKNVFCHRGLKGWSNCEQYLNYKANTLSKKHKFYVKRR